VAPVTQPTPFVILGDSPYLPTGLARIARDLAGHLWRERETLNLDLVQVAWHPTTAETPAVAIAPALPWPTYLAWDRGDDWLARLVAQVWDARWGTEPGVVLSIWDAIRCLPLATQPLPADRWGYFPIDAVNLAGGISGPVAYTVSRYDRVLGYGRWGSTILRGATAGPVPYLPHGINTAAWGARVTAEEYRWARETLGRKVHESTLVIGCVAANQPRKDLATYCQTVAELRTRGVAAHGWLHVDRLVGEAWSVPQLLADCRLEGRITVTTQLTDRQLAVLYQVSAVTIAPGLGEGFGYPIVESLAAGTPCVHTTYAGGAELVPMAAWKVPVRAWRAESLYGWQRPVYRAEDFANAVERTIEWRRGEADGGYQYCSGAVAHLEWASLWPRWASWVRAGLQEVRG
jgi:glycosyltransferase involved in cell wall biosynthesis